MEKKTKKNKIDGVEKSIEQELNKEYESVITHNISRQFLKSIFESPLVKKNHVVNKI